MVTPLLATKLYIPPLRRESIPRPRLVTRLDEGSSARLVLISAPAGFGKTTLLSEWLNAHPQGLAQDNGLPPAAWVSLDAEDNELGRFLRYLLAALATVAPEVGRETQNLLRLPQLPPSDFVLTTLINELCSLAEEIVLVLDDYHTIEAPAIHSALIFLVDNMPPQVHLVLSTRADPPMPLSRWRSRGLMAEIYADDLRFGTKECAAYLNQTMGLRLDREDLASLGQRTEGWIVGLQLVALALASKSTAQDVSAFVQTFSGSHHYIVDYLVEEVLAQQPDEVQAFLLQTSILSRLAGPLCDAVTGRTGGQKALETLEAANLFIVPLDDERSWYRYHHLFAQVLHVRLQRDLDQADLALLHIRAAAWYEAQGEMDRAFRHADEARDHERAARLIEDNWLQLGHAGEMNTVLHWMEAMPEKVVRARPMLSAAYAWVLWLTGQTDAVEPYLDAAGEAWEEQAAAGVIDPIHARWQAGGPALRTNLARLRGQLPEAIHYARQTLDLADPNDPLLLSYGHLGLAHAYRELGEYEESRTAYLKGMPLARAAGNIAAANLAAFYLSRVQQVQGHLQEAAETLKEALLFSESQSMTDSPACAILHIGLANLQIEWNELQQAEHHLGKAQDLARFGGHHEIGRNLGILEARQRLARGDAPGALAAIAAAEESTVRAEMPLARAEVAAHKARVCLALGDVASASRWAQAAARRPGQDRGYTRQFETLTLARVQMARGKLEEALDQLAQCQRAAEESGGLGWCVEIEVLEAMVQEIRGHRTEALTRLERTLSQAEPEGYVQVFVAEGPPMSALLRRAESLGVAPSYVSRLLAAQDPSAPGLDAATQPAVPPLVEPLTEREMEVLRLMAAGASNREIAAELVLAMGTVKAHLHHIYGKLGVRGRTEAAARARDLSLL